MVKPSIDANFLHRLRKREKMAMQELVDKYSATLLFLILYIVEDKSKAERILHKTIQEAISKIESYNPERESLFNWLLKCAIPMIDIDRDIIIEKFDLLIKTFD